MIDFETKAHFSTLDSFFEQFGPMDEHTRIVLEYVFELMYHSETAINELE